MQTSVRALLLLAAVALRPSLGDAQLCAGLPSLHERPIIASIDGSRATSGWSADLGITAGRRLFGGAFVGTTTYQDVSYAAQTKDAHSTTAGVGLGYEFALAREAEPHGARAGVCPTLSAQYETGPDADFSGTTFDSDGWTVGAGLSAGGLLLDRQSWRLFPFAGASFVRTSTTTHDVPFVGTDSRTTDDGWLFAFGLGVGLGRRVTVSPGMTIPAGISGGENSFTLSVNVGFGAAGK